MLSNKLIMLASPGGSQPKSLSYTWSAFLLPRQSNYAYSAYSTQYPLVQVADETYDDAKNDQRQYPFIKFGKDAPVQVGMDNPETAFLDMSSAVSDGHIGVLAQNHPALASPIGDGERLRIEMVASVMILLPEDEDATESKHALMTWKPSATSNTRFELRIVRNEMGETSLELVYHKGDGNALALQEDFSQWLLNDQKLHFSLVITKEKVEMYLGAGLMGSMLLNGLEPGGGYLTLFEPVHNYQKMNIARLQQLSIERTAA